MDFAIFLTGLIKKIDEISTLCGVEACGIIYTSNNPQPEVWPSDLRVQSLLSRYSEVSELERSKKLLTQEIFLRQKIIKAQIQLKKLRNEIMKKEMTFLMLPYLNLGDVSCSPNMIDLNDFSHLIDQNLKEIERKINTSQSQEVKPIAENGGETMGIEEKAPMNHVQGIKINADAIQK